MSFIKIETPDLEKAPIQTNPEWKITYHRLFRVSPEDADKVKVVGEGVTVWDLCFLEDLLQGVNHVKGLLLDVGWYPHADPSGSFRLLVVSLLPEIHQGRRSPYDWKKPIIDLRTRSIDELLVKIHEVVHT
jgi:hypothetical protein